MSGTRTEWNADRVAESQAESHEGLAEARTVDRNRQRLASGVDWSSGADDYIGADEHSPEAMRRFPKDPPLSGAGPGE